MDTTQTPDTPDMGRVADLTARLAAADPAEAPPVAEEIATLLGEHLDGPAGDPTAVGGAER